MSRFARPLREEGRQPEQAVQLLSETQLAAIERSAGWRLLADQLTPVNPCTCADCRLASDTLALVAEVRRLRRRGDRPTTRSGSREVPRRP